MIFLGKALFKFVTSRTAATSIEQVKQRFYNSDVEVNLRQQSKVLYVGIEDIERSKLSGNLWSFPFFHLVDVIARLVVVKRGFTCFLFFDI